MRIMNRVLLVFFVFFFIAVGPPTSNRAEAENKIIRDANGIQYSSNQIVLKTATPEAKTDIIHLGARTGIKVVRAFPQTGILLVDLPPKLSVKAAVENYSKSGLVEFAEPNYVYEADGLKTPDDPKLGQLWGLHNPGDGSCAADADIDAPEAWKKTTGSRDFIIAVIDTGIDYRHKDLKRNIWVNEVEKKGLSGIDDDDNGYVDDVYGIDTFNGDSDPMDDHYHGTHVAGTIGAAGDNGRGIVGVMWQARIMALKFLDDSGSGFTSDAIEALEYVLDMKKNHGHDIRVTNNSWGGGGASEALKCIIRQLKKEGILFVASAGNAQSNNDVIPHYPSAYRISNIIAVASTDCGDELSWFSNWGPTAVDIAAPGSDILSTMPGNTYGYLSGTSMATPHVSGLAGLIWAQRSDWPWRKVRNKVFNRGDHLSSLEGLIKKERRINANKAVPR